METLTKEIKDCLLKQLWYAALVLTLTLPDVCAALESPKGFSDGDGYKAWYDKWLKRTYGITGFKGEDISVTGDDLYYLRCGMVHQARSEHPAIQYRRIFFTLRGKSGFFAHKTMFGDSLDLDLLMFCKDMIDSVEEWFAQKKTDPNVEKNLPRLVQYYPHGLEQYIPGMDIPLIGSPE